MDGQRGSVPAPRVTSRHGPATPRVLAGRCPSPTSHVPLSSMLAGMGSVTPHLLGRRRRSHLVPWERPARWRSLEPSILPRLEHDSRLPYPSHRGGSRL